MAVSQSTKYVTASLTLGGFGTHELPFSLRGRLFVVGTVFAFEVLSLHVADRNGAGGDF